MVDQAHLRENIKDNVYLGFLVHALIEATCKLVLHLSPNIWVTKVDGCHLGILLHKKECCVQDHRNRNMSSDAWPTNFRTNSK
jgi:hypothetical protein